MAGDWIKVEHATLDKPEVSLFSELLGVPVDQGVGILIRFWVWMDRNARNGNVTHVTPSVMDTVMHCPGFSGALVTIGWVSFNEALRSMAVPNFDRHNEESAKTRSSNAERQARYRAKHRNVTSVTTPLPEKRREEKSNTSLRSVLEAPTDAHREQATGLQLDCDYQWAKYLDHLKDKGKRSADRSAGFRNWLRKAREFADEDAAKKGHRKPTLAEQRAANMKSITGKPSNEHIDSTAERLDRGAIPALPGDLREQGDDHVG